MRSLLLVCTLGLMASEPVVIRSLPLSGAENVDPGLTELRITFDQPMTDGSWSWTTTQHGPFPETTGAPRYLDDGRTCVLPVRLKPGTSYTLGVNYGKFNNFQASDGSRALPWLLRFTTGTATLDDARAKEIALAIGADLDAGAFDAVTGRFDATMTKGLTAAQLAVVWKQVQTTGTASTWGKPTCTRQGQFRVLDVPCQRENNTFVLRVTLDSTGKIAGLFVKPK